MTFKQRVEIVNEYEKWLQDFNKRNKEMGLEWGVKDCNLSFLSWLDYHKDLIKENKK